MPMGRTSATRRIATNRARMVAQYGRGAMRAPLTPCGGDGLIARSVGVSAASVARQKASSGYQDCGNLE